MFQYESFTQRNFGYLSSADQSAVAACRVLIAGCGIGSQAAEALVRIGFQNLTLVDGDIVDIHNLNRQSYFLDQVGMKKADALRSTLLRINSKASILSFPENLTHQNATSLVKNADLIFDTIDFLDLEAIVELHDQAHSAKKPIFSSFAVGFGAAMIYIPPNDRSHAWIRDIFSLPKTGPVNNSSYVSQFSQLFAKIAGEIDPQVIEVMQPVLQKMADGIPCPAPQVSPGAFSVATLTTTAAIRHLTKRPMVTAPYMLIMSPSKTLETKGINLV